MGDSEEIRTLSKRKQRLSLGESASRKKQRDKASKRPGPARTSVLRPNGIEWPQYNDDWKKQLMVLLQKLIEPMKLPSRKVPLNEIRKVEAGKRAEFRREWMMQEAVKVGFQISSYFSLRSNVALGVNCVSKSLEQEKLVGVIIEKNVSPDIITKLLIPIAEGKGVPIVAIEGLNALFKSCCGMRCIALGLKLPCADISNHFFPLLEYIQSASEEGADSPGNDEPTEVQASAAPRTPGSAKTTPKRKSREQAGNYKRKKVRKMGT